MIITMKLLLWVNSGSSTILTSSVSVKILLNVYDDENDDDNDLFYDYTDDNTDNNTTTTTTEKDINEKDIKNFCNKYAFQIQPLGT
jgi:hypothetical protein